ncbi:MAG: SDR family NAD(P)-dependent oxidoreductase [Acidimicrobiales bacterium]
MGRLDGKAAVVTGAGRGLGRAEAMALAAEGAAVVVNDPGFRLGGTDRDESVARKVAHEIEGLGGRAVPDFGDCADWVESKAMLDRAIESFGRLDVLVNNAGNLRDRMSFNMSEDDFDSVVRVHLKGHFATSHHAAGYWRERSKAGEGVRACIINTTSESGLHGNTGQLNYTVAKAGIAAMTITMARELARYGVRVNAIAPRATTRLSAFARTGNDLDEPEPSGNAWNSMDPANVGRVVAWLASDEAEFTGQVLWAVGGTVALYRGWHQVAQIEHDGPWTVDDLVRSSANLFEEKSTQPDPLPFETEGQRSAVTH